MQNEIYEVFKTQNPMCRFGPKISDGVNDMKRRGGPSLSVGVFLPLPHLSSDFVPPASEIRLPSFAEPQLYSPQDITTIEELRSELNK